jgi:hypothetical protein
VNKARGRPESCAPAFILSVGSVSGLFSSSLAHWPSLSKKGPGFHTPPLLAQVPRENVRKGIRAVLDWYRNKDKKESRKLPRRPRP